MKTTTVLACALLFASPLLPAQFGDPAAGVDLPASEVPPALPSIERRQVNFTTDGSESLQDVIASLTKDLGERPNVIFKPGIADIKLPPMRLEKVRFLDFLEALHDVIGIDVDIAGDPGDANGSRIIFVIGPGKPSRSDQTRTMPAPIGQGPAMAMTSVPVPARGVPAGSTNPFGDRVAHRPAPSSALDPIVVNPARPVRETFVGEIAGIQDVAGGDSDSYGGHPSPLTRCFAIGDLLDPKKKAGDQQPAIVDAITSMWSAADPAWSEAKDRPQIGYHDATGLLIIRGDHRRLAEAEQVLTSLREATEGQRKVRNLADEFKDAMRRNEDESHREMEHIEQLHKMTLEKLRSQHAEEVANLQERVKSLQAKMDEIGVNR